MRAHQLNPDRQIELFEIGVMMRQLKLSSAFITAAVQTATEFDGVYDLMKMWESEPSAKERDEIVADIHDMIDDCAQQEKTEAPHIKFTDLDAIAKDVQTFKDNLRMIVDRQGGVKKLAELTGIPQPSLSRFFSSGSMPRRATLLKIAKALKLDAVSIATEWSR